MWQRYCTRRALHCHNSTKIQSPTGNRTRVQWYDSEAIKMTQWYLEGIEIVEVRCVPLNNSYQLFAINLLNHNCYLLKKIGNMYLHTLRQMQV